MVKSPRWSAVSRSRIEVVVLAARMATVATSARPIMRVAAVAAVRRGWRTELSRASLPTSPNSAR